jgi:transcription elongation regulator 1
MREFEQQLEDEAAAIEAEAAQAAADAAAKRAAEAEEARMRMRAWTAHKSGDGQVYYHNTMTGESSWERPEGFAGEATAVAEGPPVPVAQASVAGTEWYEVKCQDGRRYYFNHSTQETAWSMPADVAAVKKKQAEEAAAAAERARQQAAEQRAKAAQQLQAAAPPPAAGFGGPGPPGGLGFGQPPPPGFWGNADALRRLHMQRMAEARAQGSGAGGVGGGGVLTKEGRMQRFKQLLVEAGVNAFSFYAKVRMFKWIVGV